MFSRKFTSHQDGPGGMRLGRTLDALDARDGGEVASAFGLHNGGSVGLKTLDTRIADPADIRRSWVSDEQLQARGGTLGRSPAQVGPGSLLSQQPSPFTRVTIPGGESWQGTVPSSPSAPATPGADDARPPEAAPASSNGQSLIMLLGAAAILYFIIKK